ncbi:hypothetical protein [Stappia sp.]|uniref:hypothetical protein n=1 Tax=Stappia sp. TaxID=1870903 RepID=UPI0032D905FE
MSRPIVDRTPPLRAGRAPADATNGAPLIAAIALGLVFAASLSLFGGPLTDGVRQIGLDAMVIQSR